MARADEERALAQELLEHWCCEFVQTKVYSLLLWVLVDGVLHVYLESPRLAIPDNNAPLQGRAHE